MREKRIPLFDAIQNQSNAHGTSDIVGKGIATYTSGMKRRIAQLPLHTGRAPAWLFRRMSKMAGAITLAIVEEFGPEEVLYRLADPWWFQAFGTVLGFDWHSSGVTTVTCGALKDAAKTYGNDLGIVVAGGKGATSRRTPDEIKDASETLGINEGERLVYASRISAKVDSAAVQDGYSLYHHSFVFTRNGTWCVIQQGMDDRRGWARRYHWHGESVRDFVCEPHAAVQNLAQVQHRPVESQPPAQFRQKTLLNMVAEEAIKNRNACAALVRENPDWLASEIQRYTEGPTLFAPKRHPVLSHDVNSPRLRRLLVDAHEHNPQDYEQLLGLGGMGPAAVRSLSLLAEIIFQAPPSRRDLAGTYRVPGEEIASDGGGPRWADYSFAHGGKDGTPFPVDRELYDRNISVLEDALRRSRVGDNDRFHALRRLARISNE